jgi:hypothetical protein
MQKKSVLIISCFLIIFLATGFVSASWFSDTWNKITGHAISTTCFSGTGPIAAGQVRCNCVENWTCENWSSCLNNQQTRTCRDIRGCGSTTNKPAVNQNCTSPCVSESNAAFCSRLNKSCGSVTSKDNCGISRTLNSCGACSGQTTCISGVCTANTPSCTENWQYSQWSTCNNSLQTRTATDLNHCGTTNNRGVLSQSCISNKYLIINQIGVIKPNLDSLENGANADMVDYLSGYFPNFVNGSSMKYYVGEFTENKNLAVAVAEFANNLNSADFEKFVNQGRANGATIDYDPAGAEYSLINNAQILFIGDSNEFSVMWTSNNKLVFISLQNVDSDNSNILFKSYLAKYPSSLALPSSNTTIPSNSTSTCTDSDGGLNYYVRGMLSGYDSIRKNWTSEDICDKETCINCGHYNEGQLHEVSCNNSQLESTNYQCPNGCSNGACVNSSGCDRAKLRIINFKSQISTNTSTVDIQILQDNAWVTTSKNVHIGQDVYYNNMVINLQNINVVGKRAEMRIQNGEFESVALQNGNEEMLHQQVEVIFENDEVKYLTISDCLSEPVTPTSCNDLISKIKNPSSFTDEYGNNYQASWNNSYVWSTWINGNQENVTSYEIGWWSQGNGFYYYPSYTVSVFDSKESASSYLEQIKNEGNLCSAQTIADSNGHDQIAYVCSYYYRDASNPDLRAYWLNDNKLISFYAGKSRQLNDAEELREAQMKVNEFVNKLSGSSYSYSMNNYLDWDFQRFIGKDLSYCKSQLTQTVNPETNETCSACWSCKIEPTICPEHGYQQKTCVDNCCNQQKKEEQLFCSPGICSGCMVPRWIGSNDNTCMPYGFRFAQTQQDNDKSGKINEITSDEGTIKILSDSQVYLSFSDYKNNNTYEYTLTLNKAQQIKVPNFDPSISSFTVTVTKIVPGDNHNGYIELTSSIEQSFNAYCDFDGQVKTQKTQEYDGSWAKCQNNYECFSNLCSGGECVEINNMIKEVTGYKSTGVKILCKVADIFNVQDYNTCMVNYLGADYTKSVASKSG